MFVDLRYASRNALLRAPLTSRAFSSFDRSLEICRFTPESAIVIDGFPRSANSYARAAFHQSNPGRRVVSHLHSPYLIERGLQLGVPAILLVRSPRHATASLVQFVKGLSLECAAAEYIKYYRSAQVVLGRVVTADFDEVTSGRFGAVLERCNQKFNSNFIKFEHSEGAERAIRHELSRAAQSFDPARQDQVLALPSRRRAQADDIWVGATARARRLLHQAEDMYEVVHAGARQNGCEPESARRMTL